jgi:hypothetical protein
MVVTLMKTTNYDEQLTMDCFQKQTQSNPTCGELVESILSRATNSSRAQSRNLLKTLTGFAGLNQLATIDQRLATTKLFAYFAEDFVNSYGSDVMFRVFAVGVEASAVRFDRGDTIVPSVWGDSCGIGPAEYQNNRYPQGCGDVPRAGIIAYHKSGGFYKGSQFTQVSQTRKICYGNTGFSPQVFNRVFLSFGPGSDN